MEMGPIGEREREREREGPGPRTAVIVFAACRRMDRTPFDAAIGRDRRDCPHPPGRGSIPPEILEPRRAQLCVARGVRDRQVAKPIFDRPGIDPVVGQLVAARVAQHVEVDRQRQLGAVAGVLDQPVDGVGGERRPALCRGTPCAASSTSAAHSPRTGEHWPCRPWPAGHAARPIAQTPPAPTPTRRPPWRAARDGRPQGSGWRPDAPSGPTSPS